MSNSKPGIIRSLMYFIFRFILRKQFLVGYSGKFNLKMKFKTEDTVGREIFKKGTYEDENSYFLINHLQLNAGDTFMDIGGNIGWYSILLDKSFPNIQIYSFEPEPVNADCFRYNMKLNNSENIDLVEKGVSDISGYKTMYVYKNSNKGRNSLLPINNFGTIEIEVVSLDNFVKDKHVKKVKFIKIDIEGYEYFALKGAQNTLAKTELLLMEFAPTFMRKGNINPDDVLSFLAKQKFKPYVLENGQLNKLPFEQLIQHEKNIDIYFLKEHQELINSSMINN